MIVKVQRALFPADAEAMIYDRTRQRLVVRHLTPDELLKLGDRAKGYFNAEHENDDFTLLDQVPDQPW
jgi:hypothetical protein